jgi:hypothetical protein
MFCDSPSVNDRLRITVTHHLENIPNPTGALQGRPGLGQPFVPYTPHANVDDLRTVGNEMLRQNLKQTQSSVKSTLHTHAAQQQMEIGTLSTEEEMDVGHPSFGSVKKAVKAAWNTEQTDNEYYGAVVAGQPEVAAYAAPVVEPAIAAHAIYNFFRTNK